MEAKGLTEFMWDVLYWTWACIAGAAIVGDKAWWMYSAVPVYATYMAISMVMSMRSGMAGMAGQSDGGADGAMESKRQRKMEKRGGQKVQHR